MYVDECVLECERVSRSGALCMYMSVCMNVREFLDQVRCVCR